MNTSKDSRGKVLFLATVDVTIYSFLIPHMKLLRDMGYEVEVAASNVGFTEKIEQEEFKVYNLLFSRNPFSISNIKAVSQLYRIMRKNKYLMLHTHTPVASFIGRIIARIVGVPHIVYTAHGFHFHEHGSKFKNFVFFMLEKFAGRFTDVLITINTDDYKIAKEKKIVPNGKVVYIKGVGVDVNEFNSKAVEECSREKEREKLFIAEETYVITSIGRLDREKHFGDIIKAMRVIKKRGAKFRLFIAGDGPLKNYLVNLSKRLRLQEDVFLTGYTKKVIGLLSVSDVFVFTSSREGLPVSFMEAMAMGKPVVAYNIRGVRDLVEDGVNGFLVPFGDIKGLADKIIYLMEHPGLAKEMGKTGRVKIEQDFSLRVILNQMEKLYREILEMEGKEFDR